MRRCPVQARELFDTPLTIDMGSVKCYTIIICWQKREINISAAGMPEMLFLKGFCILYYYD